MGVGWHCVEVFTSVTTCFDDICCEDEPLQPSFSGNPLTTDSLEGHSRCCLALLVDLRAFSHSNITHHFEICHGLLSCWAQLVAKLQQT
jgi:hypothetical protein